MTSITDLITEIHSVAPLVVSRSAVTSDPDVIALLQLRLRTTLITRVNALPSIDGSGASLLFQAIADSGFDQEGKLRIGDAIDAKLASAPLPSTRATTACGQKLIHVQSYCPDDVHAKFDDQRISLDSKIQLAADFLTRSGCNQPCEQTYKWWLAAILALHFKESFPSYPAVYAMLADFKEKVDASRKNFPFPLIFAYPSSPAQLPTAVIAHIYTASDIRSNAPIPRLAQIANHHIPLRKNSKLLTKLIGTAELSTPTPALSSPAPTSSTELAVRSQCPPWVDDLMALLRSHHAPPPSDVQTALSAALSRSASAALGSASPAASTPKSGRCLSRASSPQATETAAYNSPALTNGVDIGTVVDPAIVQSVRPKDGIGSIDDAESDGESEHGELGAPVEAPRLSMQAYEQQAMDALTSRNAKRKTAAAEKAKEQRRLKAEAKVAASVLKRPASAAVPEASPKVMKKGMRAAAMAAAALRADKPPAKILPVNSPYSSAAPYKKLKAIPWTASDCDRNRNTFTSMWYGRVKKHMQLFKMKPAYVVAETKRVVQLASETWFAKQ